MGPEPASPQEIHARYIEECGQRAAEAIEAMNQAFEAEYKLGVQRTKSWLSAEEVSNTARNFRVMEAAMEEAIRAYGSIYQELLKYEEKMRKEESKNGHSFRDHPPSH